VILGEDEFLMVALAAPELARAIRILDRARAPDQ
jgi:hypothetical protein